MSIYILTSMFPEGFPKAFAEQLHSNIKKRNKFAFVASEFEKAHDKTDRYSSLFLEMFAKCGLLFQNTAVIDGRMTKAQMQQEVSTADVVWLAGGNTPAQYRYFEQYGLVPVLRKHDGVIIGMSAGAINMAKTAVCSAACGHGRKEVYSALGLVDISVEPHYNKRGASGELLHISQEYPLYGLCDDGAIICKPEETIFLGEVFFIHQGRVMKML